MDLNAQLLKVINENLPAATAREMKIFIEKANEREQELLAVKKISENKERMLTHYKQKLEQAEARLKKENELIAREKAVEVAERRQEVKILEVKLEEAEKRYSVIKDLTETVFKNRTLTISKSTTQDVPVTDDHYTSQMCGSEIITKSEESSWKNFSET